MKYYLFLFGLLAAVMVLLPLLNLPKRGGDAPEPPAVSSSQQAPPRARISAGNQEQNSEASSPQQQEQPAKEAAALPVSRVESLSEPVKLFDSATGRVVTMSQQEYVLGAVCSEMPPQFHPEALKAQAVAAHSYLLRCKEQESRAPTERLRGAYLEINTENREGYVSKATARDMYGDHFEVYYPAIQEAVQQVENQILIYDDEPIVAAYHSMSGGMTEAASNVWTGSADYLVPVSSPGDRLAPDYETTETFPADRVASILQTLYPRIELPQDPSGWFADVTRSDSGYITEIQIGETTVTGQPLRMALGLRSTNAEISYQDGSFSFTVTGYGHGVGMSQYGADYMARQGSDYREILAHYYQGAELVQIK